MGHENGGWMNSEQRMAMKEAADSMREKIDSLRCAVEYGLANGKRNVIADLDVLKVVLGTGGQQYTIDELTELFYQVKSQRDKLLWCVRNVYSSLSQHQRFEIPPIVLRDLAEQCSRLNQELNLP